MAETIATAYVSIMPSMQGFKGELEKQIAPTSTATGKAAGTQLGQAMGQAITNEVGFATPRLNKVISDAAASGKVTFATKIRGIGASLVDEFKATGGISQTVKTVAQSFNGTTVSGRTLASTFRSVSGAGSGLQVGLTSLTGFLGGPWGVAMVGAGLALQGFITSQENAKKAVDSLTASADEQSGAFTLKSLQQISDAITQDLDKPGDLQRLKDLKIDLGEATAAVFKGGQAYDDYIAKLNGMVAATKGSSAAAGEQREAIRGLISTLGNQREVIGDANGQIALNTAAAQAAAAANRELGLAGDETTTVIRTQAAAQRDASAEQAIYQNMLDGIAAASQRVTDRINAIPKNVKVTAKAAGLDEIRSEADAATASLVRLLALSDSANNIATGGERHGADVSSASGTAVGRAANALSRAQAAADRAVADARAAISRHNAGASAAASGGSGARGASGSSGNLAAARKALADSIRKSFITDLVGGDAESIDTLIRKEIVLAKKALGGKKETALVSLLRSDNAKLQGLAKQRANLTATLDGKKYTLDQAQQALDGLKSQKASTIAQVSDSAVGNLVGARSVSGVRRVLTKQLRLVRGFRANMKKLVARGLPPTFLRQLFDAGIDGVYTAQALANANDADFNAIKSLTTQLSGESSKLGVDAGHVLYDTGIQTMQGLIDGLKSQDKALEDQMLTVAKSMQKAIRKALGIKSPSRVFRDLGAYTGEGFALGLEDKHARVHRALSALSASRPLAYAPGFNRSGAAVGAVGSLTVVAANDPVATAHAVANELAWRAKR